MRERMIGEIVMMLQEMGNVEIEAIRNVLLRLTQSNKRSSVKDTGGVMHERNDHSPHSRGRVD